MVIYDAETNAEELEKLSSDYAYPKNFNLEQLIKEIDEKIKKHPKLKNPAFINKKLTAYRSKKIPFTLTLVLVLTLIAMIFIIILSKKRLNWIILVGLTIYFLITLTIFIYFLSLPNIAFEIDDHRIILYQKKKKTIILLNHISKIRLCNHGLSFDVYIHQELFGHFALPFYGMHMLYDSLAVITLGYLENMSADYIQERLSTFDGVKRRYTVKTSGNNIYVDDYAHHPTAIRYVIEATRSRYPHKKIVAVFQPDRFSRGLRFAKEFAQAMDLADYPFFVHFPENAKKEPGIDIDIYDIAKYNPRAQVIHEDEEAVKLLSQYDNVVYLFMSSKDIYKLEDQVIAYKESH